MSQVTKRALSQSLKDLLGKKPFIMNVYRCVHQEQVEKYLKPQVDYLILHIIQEEIGTKKIRREDQEFVA